MKRLVLIAMLIGCSSKAPPPAPAPNPSPATTDPTPVETAPAETPKPIPRPTPQPLPPQPAPTAGGPETGQTCGDNDACAAGLECIKYMGVAGARGPQFKTCEKRCKTDASCASGQTCRMIADGPGHVCR